MEKLGMRREGHLRACERVGESWRDQFLYAILAEEWKVAAVSAC
jgi:ribosomal-protein-alanine N-acetyltransferase